MSALLKHGMYMIFFFLLALTVSEESATVEQATAMPVSATSHYEPLRDPYEKTMDYLFDHQFADMPQTAFSADYSPLSKFKCLVRLLSSFQDRYKQSLPQARCKAHPEHAPCTEAVDYYVFTLRHILI